MISSEIILLINYYCYFLLIILNLVSLRNVSTISTNSINNKYYNVDQASNTHAVECPRNWTHYEHTKSCFRVIARRMRWLEAEQACVKFGGHLASITDEYENMFAFDIAKKANLSTPTLWLGRLVKLTRSGAYEWNDGAIGRNVDGFRGELPSGTDLCLTMWLDLDRPEGSWNEWDCNYASGYSALCKFSLEKPSTDTITTTTISAKHNIQSDIGSGLLIYHSRRCCLFSTSSLCHNISQSCTAKERCIPDDLDCWTKSCHDGGGTGWCLPLPKNH